MHTTPNHAPPELTPEQRRRSMTCVIVCSVATIVGFYCTGGQVLSLFALKLGAGEVFLGLLSFAFVAPTIARLFNMTTIEKVGKRRVLLVWFSVLCFLMLPYLALPILAARQYLSLPQCLAILLVLTLLRTTAAQLGLTGWFPLLQDIVPENVTGRFFARLRICWQTAALIALLATAAYLGKTPTWRKFELIFIIGVCAYVIRALALIPVTERPPQPQEQPSLRLFDRFREIFASRRQRSLILYILCYMAAAAAPEPFKIKLMKDLGYSEGFILAAVAMTPLGAIVSLRFWGRIADRFGNRAIFSISHIGMIIVSLLWILVERNPFGSVLIFCLYLLASVFLSGNGIAQTRYILHTVPPDKQNQINIINIVSNLATALAPLLAGVFLALTRPFSFHSGALTLNNYHLLFLLVALAFIIPHTLRRRLGHRKETPTAEVIAFVTQALRSPFGPFLRLGRRSSGPRQNSRFTGPDNDNVR